MLHRQGSCMITRVFVLAILFNIKLKFYILNSIFLCDIDIVSGIFSAIYQLQPIAADNQEWAADMEVSGPKLIYPTHFPLCCAPQTDINNQKQHIIWENNSRTPQLYLVQNVACD